MNIQCSLIQELIFYQFEQGRNTTKATKNVCCLKGDFTIDHSDQMVQEISLGSQEPQQSGKVK